MDEIISHNQTFRQKNHRKEFSTLAFFVLWPFGALLYAIRKYRYFNGRNIVWLFAAFYGLTIITNYAGLDAYRYAEDFKLMAYNQLSFTEVFGRYFISNGETDFYEPLLMFLVSRITSNPNIFYAFVGLIYGYFYSRNIWFLIDRNNLTQKSEYSYMLGWLIITFSFVQALYSLQFVRFSTATVVFLYGFLHSTINNKKVGYLWMISTPFIHFSFVFPVVVALIFKIIPKKTDLFFAFFIFSTFIFETKLDVIANFLGSYVPSFLQDKVESYTNPLYAEKIAESMNTVNWYIKYRATLIIYIGYMYLSYIYFQGKNYLKNNPVLGNFFCFIMLFYGISNIFGIVPSMSRFVSVALYLLFAFIVLFYKVGPKTTYFKIINYISLPAIIIYIIVGIRISMETSGLMLFLGNPIIAFIFKNQDPLIEIIKSIF